MTSGTSTPPTVGPLEPDAERFWLAQCEDAADGAAWLVASGATAAMRHRHRRRVALSATSHAALRQIATDPLGQFTVLVCALGVAVVRYGHLPYVLLATPPLLATHGAPDIADVTNVLLPLRMAPAAEDSPRHVLRDTGARIGDAYTWQDAPVRAIFEARHATSLAASITFGLSHAELHGALVTNLPVNIRCEEIDTGALVVEYDDDVDAAVLDGILETLLRVCDSLTDRACRVRDIPRLPDGQRRQALDVWNATAIDAPFRSVVERFSAVVATHPDAVAVRGDGIAWTYRDLDERSRRCAQQLRAVHSVGATTIIGVCLEPSPWTAVALLGALRAGAAYVPLETDWPDARLGAVLLDAGVAIVMTDDAHAARLSALGVTPVVVAQEAAATPADETSPLPAPAPDDLAYVIYTSGSTGQPKGCAVEHRALAHYLHWALSYYWGAGPGGDMALFTRLSFDLTITSLYCPLLLGRTLTVYPASLTPREALARQFAPHSGVDTVKLTPAHVLLIDPTACAGTSVQLAIVGGEALTAAHVATLTAINPQMRIVNEYGPTEATVGCVVEDVVPGQPVVIGRPIANTRIYIVDDTLASVGIGARGELCIAGDGLARGYLGHEALTADRFVANPFAPGTRLYRTGDIGRWRSDGRLECFGRIDHQIKLHGHRIELGDVEAALTTCAGVRDAVAFVDGTGSSAQLTALLVSNEGAPLDRVPQQVATHLPPYMRPTRWLQVHALPLTANGKVDRTHLARIAAEPAARPLERQRRTPPQTPTEVTLAQLWCALLTVPHVDREDEFFALGGHSLRAMDLMRAIYETFGVDVPVGDLLTASSLAAMAARVDDQAQAARAPITPAPAAADYPVSHGQRSLWLLSQRETAAAYHVSMAYRVTGRLSVDALQTALDMVVARQASLRTAIVEVDGEPRQRVSPDARVRIAVHDSSTADAPPDSLATSDEALRQLLAIHHDAPFDLEAGPLLRVALVATSPTDAVLAVTVHHLISDEVSLRLLLTEWLAAYDALLRGAPTAADPLPLQYVDYAVWQHAQLAAGALTTARDYWIQQLAGPLPPLDLPTDAVRPPVPSYRGHQHHVSVPAALAQSLRTLGVQHATSTFAVLIAAVKVLLYRYTGAHDVRVGTPAIGRLRPEWAQQIGYFVNTIVLRDAVDPDEPFTTFLRRVSQTTTSALTHQEFPFDLLVAQLGLPPDTSRSPLFDVMVSYDQSGVLHPRVGGLSFTPLEAESGSSKFDLTFAWTDDGDELSLEIEYATDLFSRDRIERLSSHLLALLAGVISTPDAALHSLAVMSVAEEALVTRIWNETARTFSGGFAPDLFEARVAAQPDAIAVTAADGTVTYAALEARANQLAHWLTAAGVGPDRPVGLYMERSAALVIAILGVMKAGGAWVPLDPDLPADRIAQLIQQLAPQAVVTSAHWRSHLPDIVAPVCAIDAAQALEACPRTAPARTITDDQLAYVIFTSGSTGQPKGAMNTHAGLRNHLLWLQDTYRLQPDDVVLAKAPPGFDVSVLECLAPLVSGGRVVIAAPGGQRDPEYLATLIADEGITTLDIVPSMLRVFLETPSIGRCRALRRIIAGGEALPVALVRRCVEVLRLTPSNHYGPSECTIDATWWQCDVDRTPGDGIVPIGRPIANAQAYVLDARLHPLPIGIPGDLWVGGASVGRGYWGDAERTAASFVPDPFRPEVRHARLYRTGDRARYRHDGVIEFLGRDDAQVKLRGFRIELGEIEAALLRHPDVAHAAVAPVPRADGQGVGAIIACVVLADHATDAPDASDRIRADLMQRLPEYMVPAAIECVASIPLTANGKADLKAMVARHAARSGQLDAHTPDRVRPADAREHAVVDAVTIVLGGARVIGTNGHFFHLGGDSISAIQVVNHLARQGWQARVRDLFEAPRLDQFAQRLTRRDGSVDQGPVDGDVPLTPVQRWFFRAQRDALHHYNQSILLRLDPPVREDALRTVADALLRQHDALRLRADLSGASPRLYFGGPHALLEVHDLREADDPARRLADGIATVQDGLNLVQGPIARLALFRLPDGDRLLAVVHHMAIDGVSWRILLADLRTGLAQVASGQPVALGPKTASVQAWGHALAAAAPHADAERAWWDAVDAAPSVAWPVQPSGQARLLRHTVTATCTLSTDDTAALTTRVHRAYNTRPNDVLLTALVLACRTWLGGRGITIDLESHGRDGLPDLDVSRTVGWFTTLYPVHLDVGADATPGAALVAVKESLRQVPRHGVGYGVLRDGALRAQVLFNFLGQFDGELDDLSTSDEDRGPEHGPGAVMSHDLELTSWIADGQFRLSARWLPADWPDDALPQWLAHYRDALVAVIAHCAAQPLPTRTPSDLRYRGPAATALLARFGAEVVEDVYPLTPVQQGMLYHARATPDDTAYVGQFGCTIRGPLDEAHFVAAWTDVASTHAALRTVMVWEDVEQPLQVVCATVQMPWTVEDWRTADGDLAARHEAFEATERARGRARDGAPLMRGALVRQRDDVWRFVWTSHHLLLDGWSASMVLAEVFAAYVARVSGQPVPSAHGIPFTAYLDWLESQSADEARRFWQARLHGITAPTPLPAAPPPDGDQSGSRTVERMLSTEVTTRVTTVARALGVTASTVTRGAWALTMAEATRQQEVVFGITASGRPSALPGIAQAVGLFINTLPVRMSMDLDTSWAAWLLQVQVADADLEAYAALPLADIQRASAVPPKTPLFETLFVFENYPVDQSIAPDVAGLHIDDITARDETNYPLAIGVIPGPQLLLRATYDSARCGSSDVAHLLDRVATVLDGLTADPSRPLRECLAPSMAPALAAASEGATLPNTPPHAARPFPPRPHDAGVAPTVTAPTVSTGDLTEIEHRMRAVWCDVLEIEDVGLDDDFFDLGGHSLRAMRLAAAIRSTFQYRMPLDTLLERPTVRALSALVAAADRGCDASPCVTLRAGGAAPPLFLLPGAGGNVLYLRTLARALAAGRPVFGLQAHGLDGRTAPLTDVRTIAAAHLIEMRRQWPDGPYLLAGHSFGGRVAFEISQQLRHQGLPVAMLAVLDTPAPFVVPPAEGAGWQDADWLAKIAAEVDEFFGVSLDVTADALRPLDTDAQLSFVLDRLRRRSEWAAAMDVQQLRGHLAVYRAHSTAPYASYEAVAPVPLTLVSAADDAHADDTVPEPLRPLFADAAWGWGPAAQGTARVQVVPGGHLTMFAEPHVRVLARALDEAIDIGSTASVDVTANRTS